jgi:GNAT superfamily N-acetyltransferase
MAPIRRLLEGELGRVKLTILHGYFAGAVGQITEAHAVYYHTHWGFDVSFEAQVARELSEFAAGFDSGRDGLWVARQEERFAGSIAIDGRQAESDGARLRWYIVPLNFMGTGIGRQLIRQAVGFCQDRGYPKIYLWTFEGLNAARRVYEKFGFHLCEEHDVAQWGQQIREQKFELGLGS